MLQNRTGVSLSGAVAARPPSATSNCNPYFKWHFVPIANLSHFVPNTKIQKFNVYNPDYNQKNACSPTVCSGREMVGWLQSCALRNLFGHLFA